MKIFLLLLVILVTVISCDNQDVTPSEGISSNPNFIKGQIVSADHSYIPNASLYFSHDIDTIMTKTDSTGRYSVELDEELFYSMWVEYYGLIILEKASISLSNLEDVIILEQTIEELQLEIEQNDSLSDEIDTTLYENTDAFILDSTNYDDSYITFNLDNQPSEYSSKNFGEYSYAMIGCVPGSENRYFGKINNLSLYTEDMYKKYEIEFSLGFFDSMHSDDTLKLYLVKREWSEAEITGEEAMEDETWREHGGHFGEDIAETPFLVTNVNEIVEADSTMILDITDEVTAWRNGEVENFGFMMAYSLSREEETSYIVIQSSETPLQPTLLCSY